MYERCARVREVCAGECVCVCVPVSGVCACVCVANYLQCVEVGQPHTVSPAQVPAEVVVTDVDGLQVPSLIPEEVQHVEALGRVHIVWLVLICWCKLVPKH